MKNALRVSPLAQHLRLSNSYAKFIPVSSHPLFSEVLAISRLYTIQNDKFQVQPQIFENRCSEHPLSRTRIIKTSRFRALKLCDEGYSKQSKEK
ncbi:hypothetical protein EYC84_009133 [Monilinia fructicola]|uniref:Uncharacterized protein n=1 Tax=Monilinia fructicola TaxID=38448 RepID=A0A5M9JCX5_MONFR|nr:hypothetical protein EYC84_009133 [Monilinia fructicola]